VLGHTGISVDGHRPDQHGQVLTLPIAIHQQASGPVGSGDQAPAVCAENLIRVDEVMESPKLAE
jgi:hypothetical protein